MDEMDDMDHMDNMDEHGQRNTDNGIRTTEYGGHDCQVRMPRRAR
jgi:hypothetical protein